MNTWQGMTYEEAHRAMWRWLAENPDKDKQDWFQMLDVYVTEKIPVFMCFACEACRQYCDACPIRKNSIGCNNGGLFAKWRRSRDLKERAKLAKQIAELPWR